MQLSSRDHQPYTMCVMQGWCDVLLCPEEQPGGEGEHHQAAEGGAEAGGGQAGAAEEAPPEPDTAGQPAEGQRPAAAHRRPLALPVCCLTSVSTLSPQPSNLSSSSAPPPLIRGTASSNKGSQQVSAPLRHTQCVKAEAGEEKKKVVIQMEQ